MDCPSFWPAAGKGKREASVYRTLAFALPTFQKQACPQPQRPAAGESSRLLSFIDSPWGKLSPTQNQENITAPVLRKNSNFC